MNLYFILYEKEYVYSTLITNPKWQIVTGGYMLTK